MQRVPQVFWQVLWPLCLTLLSARAAVSGDPALQQVTPGVALVFPRD